MRSSQIRRSPLFITIGLVVTVSAAFAIVGCGNPQPPNAQPSVTTAASVPETTPVAPTTTGSSPTTTVRSVETTTAPVSTSTSTSLPPTTASQATTTSVLPPSAGLSAKSIAYARRLGGKSHLGETLYFVVGASEKTEKKAQAALDNEVLTDMQTYFIVQKSDNFEGMKPGWWVVFEARRTKPATYDWDLYRTSFPGAYLKQATVRTSDPIPVYEDLLPGA
jgi:hypothetical protein